jgi:hypothetical protein
MVEWVTGGFEVFQNRIILSLASLKIQTNGWLWRSSFEEFRRFFDRCSAVLR